MPSCVAAKETLPPGRIGMAARKYPDTKEPSCPNPAKHEEAADVFVMPVPDFQKNRRELIIVHVAIDFQ